MFDDPISAKPEKKLKSKNLEIEISKTDATTQAVEEKIFSNQIIQTEVNHEAELLESELKLKFEKIISDIKFTGLAINGALFVNNISQARGIFIDEPCISKGGPCFYPLARLVTTNTPVFV